MSARGGRRTGGGKAGFLAPLVSHSIGGGGIFHSLWKSAGCFPGFAAFFLKKGPLSPERGPFCPLRFPQDEADRTPPAIPGEQAQKKGGAPHGDPPLFFHPRARYKKATISARVQLRSGANSSELWAVVMPSSMAQARAF